jgi:transposase
LAKKLEQQTRWWAESLSGLVKHQHRLWRHGSASLVASFAKGVTKDKAAINAAVATCWSNGQTLGQITKLWLVKRQMYGAPGSTYCKLVSSAPNDQS